ncbi:YdcF family protein [Chitinophaga qingshengii]|uniref:YdcF family protein n=1 Tax=Chitinophaga qingshengii TaxID=1569794 RepID=A0ABR7TG35_9BACT|nr:YdcF family protein [Chitinophaga qingshengii]MBC9929347.1 YdcF family protein [Chitinophaga qingshengii]
MKHVIWIIALLCTGISTAPAQNTPPDPGYRLLKEKNEIVNRNVYLFTLLEQLPAVNRLLTNDTLLQRWNTLYRERLQAADSLTALRFDEATIARFERYWPQLLQQHPTEMDDLLQQMRRSGFFQLYARKTDAELLANAWLDAAHGVNYILNAYTHNTGFRYPKIDSAAFYVKSPGYQKMLRQLLHTVAHKTPRRAMFFQPSLSAAIGLLELNKHDECARYQPLEKTNSAAYTKVKSVDWDKYKYAALLIPGAGPGSNDPISDAGKNRCRIGAEMYRKGSAPFIIVSGGHVHPFGTPYAEAVEMKKYLVNELKIPAEAVILEPHARHTTTNVRNAVRIAWKSGMPLHKRMLCVSDALQLYYVNSAVFSKRCQEELGYQPATDIQQADLYYLSFIPNLESLQANSMDPLDP